jgi:hypothetical protein
VAKTDASGNMQWNQTVGSIYVAHDFVSLDVASDGGYILACTRSGALIPQFFVVKTDEFGVMEWNQTYVGDELGISDFVLSNVCSIIATSDGGYALAGNSDLTKNDFWVIKTNSTGHVEWNQTYSGTGYEYACSLVEASGGYVIAGTTTAHPQSLGDFWLVKTDTLGNMQWNQTYEGSGWAWSLCSMSDGGYVIAGYMNSGVGEENKDFWVVKTDASGNMQWNQTYGGAGTDWAYAVTENSDGGCTVVGYTDSFGAGGTDIWVIRTDEYGNASQVP